MNCEYSIKVNGQKVTVLKDIQEDIKDINDLERLLKKQSPEILQTIKDALYSANQIEEISLDDINEGAIGVYSPGDLINSITKTVKDAKLLSNLSIGKDTMKKKLVIAGFGKADVPTQYKNDHLFLNLNYLYDYDNKIIALTELAIKSKFSDPSITSEKVIKDDALLRQIINTEDEEKIKSLSNLIKSAYTRANLKLTSSLSETNIQTERGNLESVYNEFYNKDQQKDYLPKSRIRVENLRQGDMVLIPVKSDNYKNGVYEMFYDSYVDIDGNTIIRTLVNFDGQVQTRNRIAQIYARDGQVVNIRPSDIVEAKAFVSKPITDILKPTGPFSEIKVRFTTGKSTVGITYGDSIVSMIKNGAKVVIKKDTYGVKQINGSIVILDNNQEIPINKITTLSVPYDESEVKTIPYSEATLDNGWTEFKDPVLGEQIAFKKSLNDENLTVAKVIGMGINNNRSVVYYSDGKSVGFINESNIRFMGNPPNEFTVGIEEENEINQSLNFLRGTDGNIISVLEQMTKYKNGSFRDSKYSVQDLNEYSQLTPKDILVSRNGVIFKVVSSKGDYVKLVQKTINGNIYTVINRNSLNLFTLLTKRPVNKTFANANIIKNRYNLYNNASDGAVEARVYKKQNGYVYSLPASLTVEELHNHALYSTSDIDYTSQMKKELKDRYGWESIPNSLYMIPSGNSMLKDTNNTVFIPMDNPTFQKVMANKQTCIVPGTYLKFKGDSRAYLVEKVYADSSLLSYYHYTNSVNPENSSDLKYVKFTKTIFSPNNALDLEITGLHLPKWADAAYKEVSKILLDNTDFTKQSSIKLYPKSDSPELVNSMVNFIRNKYGVKINIIHNRDLPKFSNPEVYQSSAFVSKNAIYVNIDRASIEEPLHELLHLVLATMKSQNPNRYYQLVNSVQYHPMFNDVASIYNEVNTEVLEETFVKLLSSTFRNNILKTGVFDSTNFSTAIKDGIKELLGINSDLTWKDSFNLLGTPVNKLLFDFGSDLVENEESLINDASVSFMFDVSDKINTLFKNGDLTQKCDF